MRGNWIKSRIGTIEVNEMHEMEMEISISPRNFAPYVFAINWRGGFTYTYSFLIDFIEKDFTKVTLPTPNYRIVTQHYTYKNSHYDDINELITRISQDFEN